MITLVVQCPWVTQASDISGHYLTRLPFPDIIIKHDKSAGPGQSHQLLARISCLLIKQSHRDNPTISFKSFFSFRSSTGRYNYKSHFYHGNIYSNSESNLNLIPWSRFKSFQDTIRAIRPQWPHIGGRTLGCRGLQLPRLRCHDPIIFNCRPRADNNKYLNASMLP